MGGLHLLGKDKTRLKPSHIEGSGLLEPTEHRLQKAEMKSWGVKWFARISLRPSDPGSPWSPRTPFGVCSASSSSDSSPIGDWFKTLPFSSSEVQMTAIKSIIDFPPGLSWCHLHWWTHLCLNTVFIKANRRVQIIKFCLVDHTLLSLTQVSL